MSDSDFPLRRVNNEPEVDMSNADEALEIVSRVGSAIGLMFGAAKLELVKNCGLSSDQADGLLLESIEGMLDELTQMNARVRSGKPECD